MDEIKVTKDLKEEVLKWCDSFEYCGGNLVYLLSRNKLNIMRALAIIIKANPEFVISTMETTKGEESKLETGVQFIQVGFTGG